ncbi:hypothetical protein [Methylobacter marinus]|uniref:hypothetical protein n=1 Tax=Methylobacter marinus TaxID=34058 RepID=UPI0003655F11|nr:hypothetical protein [Methylobacter marinus]
MTTDINELLAMHSELAEQLHYAHDRIGVYSALADKIRAEGRAVQFQLLLHMPCRQFFKLFNINREAAL